MEGEGKSGLLSFTCLLPHTVNKAERKSRKGIVSCELLHIEGMDVFL